MVIPLGRDPQTGKKRQLWRSYRTRREAEAQLGRLLAQVQAGDVVPPSRLRTGDYLERWLRDDVGGRLAPTTEAIYTFAVRRYILPALGHIALSRLSAPAIQGCLNAMLLRGLAGATVHQVSRALNTALNTAVEWGLLARNPCKYVKAPCVDQRAATIWDEEQVRLFLAEAKRSSRYYRLYLGIILTGMRPGEALALRWPNIDLVAGEIAVHEKFYRLGRRQLWGTTKTHRQYAVSIPPILVEELRRHREEQQKQKSLLGEEYEEASLVFCQPNGRPLHERNIGRRDFRRVIARAGLPRIRLYDLRHCNATHLAEQGTPIHIVQRRLGHRSPTTTLKYYTHVIPATERAAADRLADRLLGYDQDTGISRD